MSERKRYQMLIDGEWVDAEDGKIFDSVNPATGAVWAEIPEASEADVNRAVEAAHRAFLEGPWSKTTPSERGRYLRKLADLLAESSEMLGRTETVLDCQDDAIVMQQWLQGCCCRAHAVRLGSDDNEVAGAYVGCVAGCLDAHGAVAAGALHA